jgi:hypothetical protein
MNGMEKLIKVMRKEGSRNNPDPLVLGEMTAKDKVEIKGMEFEGDDLYIAEHLLDQEVEVSFENWKTQTKSGGTGYAEFASHYHEIDVSKNKMKIHSTLKKGDLVLCYRVADDKYVIIEKVVSG